MDRRIKLTIAFIAFGLLSAGAVRRWTKEGGLSRERVSPSSNTTTDAFDSSFQVGAAAGTSEFNPRFAAGASTPVSQAAHLVDPGSDRAAAPSTGGYVVGASFSSSRPDATSPLVNSAEQTTGFDNRGEYLAPPQPQPAPREDYSANAPPTPTAAPTGVYVIQPYDSFWTISQRVYGTGRYFQALAEHNRRVCPQPDCLPPGVVIETPEPYLLERNYPDLFR